MKVFCILGDERVSRSRSPTIFSAVMQSTGIRASYVPFRVRPEDLGKAIQSLRVLHMAGANITVPYKEAVLPHLDILSEGANIIGAVNTIVINGNGLKGYNTNAIGIMDTLTDCGFAVEGKSALVFGTGGAAKAAVFILNWLRTHTIYVTGRDPAKGGAVIARFGGEFIDLNSLDATGLPVQIVVNATSVSSRDESPELAEQIERLDLPECELVLDLNYGRVENFWEEMARANGIRFVDGLLPLAFQARRTFALWTGLQVPPGEFLKAIEIT